MALTDMKIKSLTAKENAYTIADSGGLQVKVSPSGLKTWEYRYRMNGAKGKQNR